MKTTAVLIMMDCSEVKLAKGSAPSPGNIISHKHSKLLCAPSTSLIQL